MVSPEGHGRDIITGGLLGMQSQSSRELLHFDRLETMYKREKLRLVSRGTPQPQTLRNVYTLGSA